MSPNNNTKTAPTTLNSDLFISPPMNKCSGAGASSLTIAQASCHLHEFPGDVPTSAFPMRFLHRVRLLFSSLNPNCRARARPARFWVLRATSQHRIKPHKSGTPRHSHFPSNTNQPVEIYPPLETNPE